jgi:hypothetical protein
MQTIARGLAYLYRSFVDGHPARSDNSRCRTAGLRWWFGSTVITLSLGPCARVGVETAARLTRGREISPPAARGQARGYALHRALLAPR